MFLRFPASLILLTSLAALSPAWAQSQGSHALEGAWNVQVTANPGAPGPANFQTLITFASGTTIELNGQPGFGPAMGQWKFTGNQTYEATWLKFIYNPQGQRVGTVKVRAKIRMITEDEYTHDGSVAFYDLNGTLLVSWTDTAKGTRIVVESSE